MVITEPNYEKKFILKYYKKKFKVYKSTENEWSEYLKMW